MGVPKFFRWISERYPKINQPVTCKPRYDRPTFYNDDGSPALYVGKPDDLPSLELDSGSDGENREAELDDIDECVIIPEFDRLYLDMNGIIHGCSHNNANQDLTSIGSGIVHDEENGNGITEEEIINNACHYIDRIVGDIVKPTELVYVAIDGVAPRAKLNQQRSRRFRSGKESEIAASTAQAAAAAVAAASGQEDEDFESDSSTLSQTTEGRFAGTLHTGSTSGNTPSTSTTMSEADMQQQSEIELDGGGVFQSNAITPGSPFLEKVSKHIRHFIHHKLHHDAAWKHLKIIYSGPEVPGEGEHKIMQFIRDEKNLPGYNPNTRHCLFGQDGDLIMLGLATHEPHFALLREEVKFGRLREKADAEAASVAADANCGGASSVTRESINQYVQNSKFELLHMSALRDYLALEFETSNMYPDSPFHLEPTIDDFVFMTFFVGNDFLPHMPALDIGDGAFDLLFFTYKKHRRKWLKELKEEEGKDGDTAYPYFTHSGRIVDGWRLERFLGDIGRHEDPVLHQKKKEAEALNKKIRKDEKKYRGRMSIMPSAEELVIQEKEKREKYKDMLENIEVPLNGLYYNSFAPVLSSGKLPGGVGRRKHEPPQMPAQPELTAEVEEGVLGRLSNLVLNSISPEKKEPTSIGFLDANAKSISDGDLKGDVGLPVVTAEKSYEDKSSDDISTDLKGRYYYDKFNFTPLDSEKHRALRKSYVEGLVWCLNYYYRGCASWEWFYPYHYGPMLSDLVDLNEYIADVSFEKGSPLRPFEQLLGCLPPSSSHMLPEPYRWLMTSPESPIHEYYPKDFDVDMNGKRFPWEAVVLLPFIDSSRLIDAVKAHVKKDDLTSEELARNNVGKARLFRRDDSAVDVLPPVGESTGFGAIVQCKSCSQIYNDVDWGDESKAVRFRPELLPGTLLPYPGFPTLTEAPIQGLLRKKVGLNIFGTPSRYVTALLMTDSKLPGFPSLEVLASKFIGTTVYFRYPYLQEAFVTAVSDAELTVRGMDKPRRWTEDEAIEWDSAKDATRSEYRSGNGRTGSGGWLLPQSKVTLSVRPLKGVERLPNGVTVKVYSKTEWIVPLAAALWSPSRPDPRFHGVPARLEKNPFMLQRPPADAERVASIQSGGDSPSDLSQKHKEERKDVPLEVGNKGGRVQLSSFSISESHLSALSENGHAGVCTAFVSSVRGSAMPVLSSPSGIGMMSRCIPGSSRSFSNMAQATHRALPQFQPVLKNRSALAWKGLDVSMRRFSARVPLVRGASAFAVAAMVLSSAALNQAKGVELGRTASYSHLNRIGTLRWPHPSPILTDEGTIIRGLMHEGVLLHGDMKAFLREKPLPSETAGAPLLEFAHGTTTISFVFKDGIVAAVDSRASIGSFVGSKTTQKVLPINKHILGTMAGGAADCSFWIRHLRAEAKLLELSDEVEERGITVARASRILANALYEYRALKLSVGTMIMGYDCSGGKPSIYFVNDSGLRIRGDMFAVGSGSTFALGILDTERRSDMSESEAIALAIKAIRHATFRDAYSGGYIGVYVITKEGWRKVFSEDLALLSEHERASVEGKK